MMIDPDHERLSIRRQCELVSISRASFYRQPAGETPENLELMRIIDEAFMEIPWYGSRQMARHLRRQGRCVGRKRVRRLMRKIGLSPIYQAPRTSEPHPQHRIYPYLLRHLAIERPNQVWCADVTYIPMRRGFLYLVASWTGSAARSWPGGCRTRWMPISVLPLSKKRSPAMAGPTSSTPTKARSSPASPSRR
jgi:putative transposase